VLRKSTDKHLHLNKAGFASCDAEKFIFIDVLDKKAW